MESNCSFRIQADLIVVSGLQYLAPGQIEIRHGRIIEVTGRLDRTADAVLEGVALLPGLVNPHTHLEFSDLQQPLSADGDFPAWVGRVLQQRHSRGVDTERLLANSIRAGLEESLHSGVFGLVDIVTPPWKPNLLRFPQLQTQSQATDTTASSQAFNLNAAPYLSLSQAACAALAHHLPKPYEVPRVIACIEQLGLTQERIQQATQWRESVLGSDHVNWPERLQALAISPHAPYSTPESLWRDCAQLASNQRRLIAMHLVESPAERQWLDSGTGPFAEMLARLGAENHRPAANRIQSICTALAQASHALIIHGNYFSKSEMDHLSGLSKPLSIVYCPRTHMHFAHIPYPLEDFRQRGLRVVFGTDSRSSNPDLNLWQEARCALSRHASLSPIEAFSAISNSAAQAVGIEEEIGSLSVGALAALNILPLPQPTPPKNINTLFAEWFETATHPQPLMSCW